MLNSLLRLAVASADTYRHWNSSFAAFAAEPAVVLAWLLAFNEQPGTLRHWKMRTVHRYL
jgi:hypothetical protein